MVVQCWLINFIGTGTKANASFWNIDFLFHLIDKNTVDRLVGSLLCETYFSWKIDGQNIEVRAFYTKN